MTLEEEYENQESWRTSHDKLTFIVCEPLSGAASNEKQIKAQVDDSPVKMKGDINFFLYLANDDEVAEPRESSTIRLTGEVDVMIANTQHRGKGVGEAAVRSILAYIRRNLPEILKEYAQGEGLDVEKVQLVGLMAKIKQENTGSRALFKKLGFRQEGEANYFGEVKMVMGWEARESEDMAEVRTHHPPTHQSEASKISTPSLNTLNLKIIHRNIRQFAPDNTQHPPPLESAGIFQKMNSIIRLARPLLAPRISALSQRYMFPPTIDVHMPLSSPPYLDLIFPPQQPLHSTITGSGSGSDLARIRRPRAHGGSVLASRPARPAAALRAAKYHEWPHEAGAEAETWVAEEDEE
ncbi:uncharacterized protein Triagg1_4403 [Trichoderma aggressivum f. europaeum]|uniref:N-acetyltransferase domain-containing protein n=1 Tax=Trichoderma aggressivum f. europaeum TaxID=173218 RepID=A0AAE1JAY3_9HYPO|nr:hypothetical protein Triagg1_4403 [Trichoderma aggressivum f. europaeum]